MCLPQTLSMLGITVLVLVRREETAKLLERCPELLSASSEAGSYMFSFGK